MGAAAFIILVLILCVILIIILIKARKRRQKRRRISKTVPPPIVYRNKPKPTQAKKPSINTPIEVRANQAFEMTGAAVRIDEEIGQYEDVVEHTSIDLDNDAYESIETQSQNQNGIDHDEEGEYVDYIDEFRKPISEQRQKVFPEIEGREKMVSQRSKEKVERVHTEVKKQEEFQNPKRNERQRVRQEVEKWDKADVHKEKVTDERRKDRPEVKAPSREKKPKVPNPQGKGPNYVSDMERIRGEIKDGNKTRNEERRMEELKSPANAGTPPNQGSKSSYVNDLNALLYQIDGQDSDENDVDKYGYVLYNPKRETKKGRKGSKDVSEGRDGELYENSSFPVKAERKRKTSRGGKEGEIYDIPTEKNKKSHDIKESKTDHHYMNSLDTAMKQKEEAAAKASSAAGTGKPHRPYVNSEMIKQALLASQENLAGDDEAVNRSKGGGNAHATENVSEKDRRDSHHYVNDLVDLLPLT